MCSYLSDLGGTRFETKCRLCSFFKNLVYSTDCFEVCSRGQIMYKCLAKLNCSVRIANRKTGIFSR